MESKRLDIQLLRAIAVVLVVFFHLGIGNGSGYLGVDIFFVISGFVITNSLVQRSEGSGGLSDSLSFLIRRAKRLLPALFWMVTVTTALSSVFLSPFDILPTAIATAIAAVFGTGNIVIALQSGDYFALPAESNPFLHTWSLGIEEQFYFSVAILMLLGGGAAFLRSRLAFVMFATLFIASLATFSLGTTGLAVEGWQTLIGFYSPVSRAWELTSGVLLALFFHHRRTMGAQNKKVVIRSYLAWAALICLVFTSILPDMGGTIRGPLTFLAVGLTALVIWGGIANEHLKSKAFRPFILVGDYSYTVYLWHWPVSLFTKELLPSSYLSTLIAVLAIIVTSFVSGRWFEFPFSKGEGIRQLFRRKRLWSALASLVLATGATLAAFTIPYPASHLEKDTDLKAGVPCEILDDFSIPCEIVHGNNGTLLVVGDSTALPFFSGANQYAANHGFTIAFSSNGGCPAVRPGARYPRVGDCESWQEHLTEYLQVEQPDEVWLINRSGAYTNPSLGFYGILSEDGVLLRRERDIVSEWSRAIEFLVHSSPASKFVVFQGSPEPPSLRDSRTLINAMLGRYPELEDGFDRAKANEARLNGYRAHELLVENGAVLVDPFDALCSPYYCEYLSDYDQEIYWDNSHLSLHGANQVLSHFGFIR